MGRSRRPDTPGGGMPQGIPPHASRHLTSKDLTGLARAALMGSSDDHDRLLNACWQYAYDAAIRFGRKHHGAEDTAQNAAMAVCELLKGRAAALTPDTVGGFVRVHVLRSAHAAAQRRLREASAAGHADPTREEPDSALKVETAEWAHVVRDVVDALPPRFYGSSATARTGAQATRSGRIYVREAPAGWPSGTAKEVVMRRTTPTPRRWTLAAGLVATVLFGSLAVSSFSRASHAQQPQRTVTFSQDPTAKDRTGDSVTTFRVEAQSNFGDNCIFKQIQMWDDTNGDGVVDGNEWKNTGHKESRRLGSGAATGVVGNIMEREVHPVKQAPGVGGPRLLRFCVTFGKWTDTDGDGKLQPEEVADPTTVYEPPGGFYPRPPYGP